MARPLGVFASAVHISGAFDPSSLTPYAWYDAHTGGSSTQVTDSSSNSRAALAFAASTASPLYLPYSSTPYVYLPAVSGNSISMPDAAALDVVGDMELVVRIDRSVNTADYDIMTKAANSQSSWIFRVLATTNTLRLFGSTDGSAVSSATSSTGLAYSAGTPFWAKVTRRQSDGRVQFFYADDAATEPGSWNQLGTDQTLHSGANLFSSTADLYIGSGTASTRHYGGNIYAAIYRDGIGGTTVADFKASLCGQNGYTDAVGTAGGVWTVNYSNISKKAVVKSSVATDTAGGVVAGTDDYATGPTAAIPPLTSGVACTLLCVARPRTTQANNKTFFSTRSGSGAGVTLRMSGGVTAVADISDGTTTVTTGSVTLSMGTRYVLGVAVPAAGAAYVFANAATSSTVARTGNDETGGALTAFAQSTPTNYIDIHSRVPYMSFDYELNGTQIADLVTYYGGGA